MSPLTVLVLYATFVGVVTLTSILLITKIESEHRAMRRKIDNENGMIPIKIEVLENENNASR